MANSDPVTIEASKQAKLLAQIAAMYDGSDKPTRDRCKMSLASGQWRSFRNKIIDTRITCQVCLSQDRLIVHHNHYRTLGKEKQKDVYLLCNRCHRIVHGLAHTIDSSRANVNNADTHKLESNTGADNHMGGQSPVIQLDCRTYMYFESARSGVRTIPDRGSIPSDITDKALVECSPSAFKILYAVAILTTGSSKLWDRISLSQLEKKTHLTRNTVLTGLEELERNNWIVSRREGQYKSYAMFHALSTGSKDVQAGA